jgi:hypothetical protein
MLTHPHSSLRAALLLLFAIAFSGTGLCAQALPAATGPGTSFSFGGGASLYQSDYGQERLAGLQATVDLNPTWRYGVEAEGRFLRYKTASDAESVSETTYLIGPRFTLPRGRTAPYVKFLIGEGKLKFPFDYAEGSYLVYAPGGGLDYQLSDRISWRVVDLEYQIWPQFTYGQLHPYGISTGFLFHIHPMSPLPDSHSGAKSR